MKRPQIIKSMSWFGLTRIALEEDDIENECYFPIVTFSSCPQEIHDKEVYVHSGIIDEFFKDYEILKESQIQMKHLNIDTEEFKEFPDKIELSDSILSSIESIFVEQAVVYYLEVQN